MVKIPTKAEIRRALGDIKPIPEEMDDIKALEDASKLAANFLPRFFLRGAATLMTNNMVLKANANMHDKIRDSLGDHSDKIAGINNKLFYLDGDNSCLLYTSPSQLD